jgi:hypothetical protein
MCLTEMMEQTKKEEDSERKVLKKKTSGHGNKVKT